MAFLTYDEVKARLQKYSTKPGRWEVLLIIAFQLNLLSRKLQNYSMFILPYCVILTLMEILQEWISGFFLFFKQQIREVVGVIFTLVILFVSKYIF